MEPLDSKICNKEEVMEVMKKYFETHLRFKATHVADFLVSSGIEKYMIVEKQNKISEVSSHSIKKYLFYFRRDGAIKKVSNEMWESLIYDEDKIIIEVVEDERPTIVPREELQRQSD
jgi:hypothetical protein